MALMQLLFTSVLLRVTVLQGILKQQMLDLAEFIWVAQYKTIKRNSCKEQHRRSGAFLKKYEEDKLHKAYVCVDKNGVIAKHRKLHPFINPYIIPGDSYCVFELFGWKCGILICYDNNIIENVRATNLLGADIIFMPHVTMCTPSPPRCRICGS